MSETTELLPKNYIKFDAKNMTVSELEKFLAGPDIPYDEFDFNSFRVNKVIRTKRIAQSVFPILSHFIEDVQVLVICDTIDNTKANLNGKTNKTAFTDGLDIYFHSRFAEALTSEQFTGIYFHELFHILLNHTKRLRNRKPVLHNIACDYFIERVLNEFTSKREYEKLIQSASFSCLDRSNTFDAMSSEEIYEYLVNNKPKMKNDESTSNYGNKSKIDVGADGGISINGDIIGNVEDLVNTKVYNSKGELVDIKSNIESSGKREASNQNQRVLLESNKDTIFGKMAALFEREFDIKIEEPKVNWKKVLQNFIVKKFSADYSWHSKRSTEYGSRMTLPNIVEDGSTIKIGVVIDTSGSMGKEEMDNAMTELWHIMKSFKSFEITLMCCDADIDYKNIKKIKKKNELYDFTIGGGGGTSFIPPFKYFDKLKKLDSPHVILYFTDCYGSYPEIKKRNYETIWVITHDGIDEKNDYYPPFGRVAYLTD